MGICNVSHCVTSAPEPTNAAWAFAMSAGGRVTCRIFPTQHGHVHQSALCSSMLRSLCVRMGVCNVSWCASQMPGAYQYSMGICNVSWCASYMTGACQLSMDICVCQQCVATCPGTRQHNMGVRIWHTDYESAAGPANTRVKLEFISLYDYVTVAEAPLLALLRRMLVSLWMHQLRRMQKAKVKLCGQQVWSMFTGAKKTVRSFSPSVPD